MQFDPCSTWIHANIPEIHLHANEVSLNIHECIEAKLKPQFNTIQLKSEIAAAVLHSTLPTHSVVQYSLGACRETQEHTHTLKPQTHIHT